MTITSDEGNSPHVSDDKTAVTAPPSTAPTTEAVQAQEAKPAAEPSRASRVAVAGVAAVAVVAAAIAVAFAAGVFPSSQGGQATPATTGDGGGGDDDAIDHYTCTMHPSVHQAGPGKCPICGMDLVPVTKAQSRGGDVVVGDEERRLVGIKTAPVAEAPLYATLRAAGRVAFDEEKIADVTWRAGGFVTKLVVAETGRRVRRGETLAVVYSPDIYAAERDLLVAQKLGAKGVDVEAARTRLRLLGVDDAQIDAVVAAGAAQEGVRVIAPISGVVVEKNIVDGAAFEAGARLFRLAALDRVWIEADLYQGDVARVKAGDAAVVTLDDDSGRRYDAVVATIEPSLDESARTARVRFKVKNADGALLPGMYATVTLARDLGPRLQVPASAVVYTGPRRLVFVAVGDGRFRAQEVVVGAESSDGSLEIKDGLHAGDVIVTSGVFLIASEARIAGAPAFADDAATPPSPPPPPSPAPAPSTRAPPTNAPPPTQAPPAPAHNHAAYWCPMHHDVRSDEPGTCPRCGMTLVPIPEGEGAP